MHLRYQCTVPLSLATVFHFHENPSNLAVLLRECPSLRILHHSGSVRPGSTTWVEQTIARALPVVMGFRHTVYEPPRRFGEELIHGPFSIFRHIHEFEEADAGTMVRDLLDLELPWYYGGTSVLRTCIAPGIDQLFHFRHEALLRLAGQTGLICESNPGNDKAQGDRS